MQSTQSRKDHFQRRDAVGTGPCRVRIISAEGGGEKGLLSHGKDARKELRGVNVGVFNSKKERRVAEAKD